MDTDRISVKGLKRSLIFEFALKKRSELNKHNHAIVTESKTARVLERPGGAFFFQKYTVPLLLLRSTCTRHHSKEKIPKFFPVSFKKIYS